MSLRDRKPLRDHPTWSRISRSANNRLGAVFQAIHSFLSARERALISNYPGAVKCQYDAYSAILFDQTANEVFTNVTGETPDNLLTKLLDHRVNGGADFNGALRKVHQVMDTHWNSERSALNPSLTRHVNLLFTMTGYPWLSFYRMGSRLSMKK